MYLEANSTTDPNAEPIRVILYGRQFAATGNCELAAVTASGPGCLKSLALQLFAAGFDPDRVLTLHRGGEEIGTTTIGVAAGVSDDR